MPRDGSGIYTKPYPSVVTGTTIASVEHNGTVDDIATDLNAVRPIVAGGTGGNNALTARTNLQAERTFQEVTNFDSHVWEAGSFYAAPGTTASPSSGAWIFGTSLNRDSSGIGIIEAYDMSTTPPTLYVRSKSGSVWSAWTVGGSDQYVNVTGDTMTGPLIVQGPSWPAITLNNTTTGTGMLLTSSRNGLQRWQLRIGDEAVETGGDVGTDFSVYCCTDGGVAFNRAFIIERKNGQVQSPNVPIYNSSVANKLYVDTTVAAGDSAKVNKIGDTMTGHLTLSATNIGVIAAGDTSAGGGGFMQFWRGAGANWTWGHKSVIYGDGLSDLIAYNHAHGLQMQLKADSLQTLFGGSINAPGTSTFGDIATSGGVISSAHVIAYGNAYAGYASAKVGALYFGNDSTTALATDTSGNYYFSGPSKALTVSGAIYGGSNIQAAGDLYAGTGATGMLRLGNTGAYIFWDGAKHVVNGLLYAASGFAATSVDCSGGTISCNWMEGPVGIDMKVTGGPDYNCRLMVDASNNLTISPSTGGIVSIGSALAATSEIYSGHSVYGFRHSNANRNWGIASISGGSLTFDDISAGVQIAQFQCNQGDNKANLYMPRHSTTVNGPNGSWTNAYLMEYSSSARFKRNIKPLDPADAFRVLQFEPVTFTANTDICTYDDPDQIHIGLIAEQVAEIEPRLVSFDYTDADYDDLPLDKDGRAQPRKLRDGAKKVPKSIDYGHISVLLLEVVKQQQAHITAQGERITELARRLEALERKRR